MMPQHAHSSRLFHDCVAASRRAFRPGSVAVIAPLLLSLGCATSSGSVFEGEQVLGNANCPLRFVVNRVSRSSQGIQVVESFSAPYGNLTPNYRKLEPGAGEVFAIIELEVVNSSQAPQKFQGDRLVGYQMNGSDQVTLQFGGGQHGAVTSTEGSRIEFYSDFSKQRDRSAFIPLSSTSRDIGRGGKFRYTLLAPVHQTEEWLLVEYDKQLAGKLPLVAR